MRTHIVLDEALVEEAMRYAPVKSKRELVDLALRELVANRRRRNMRELFGSVEIDPNYDYSPTAVERIFKGREAKSRPGALGEPETWRYSVDSARRS